MKKQQGFSLIELLIVVSIMLVIAAIAVPAVIASAQAGNESSAANAMRTVISAENGYHQLYGSYPATGAKLGGAVSATGCPNIPALTGGCFLPDAVATKLDGGAMSGYTFTYAQATADDWTLSATPTTASKGRKSFFTDQSGVIRYNNTPSGATVADLPLGQ